MADTVRDIRLPVRAAAVSALSHAILDKHALSVPAPVLSTIFKDVLAPVAIVLGRILESAAKKSQDVGIREKSRNKFIDQIHSDPLSADQMEQEIKLLEMLAACEPGANESNDMTPKKKERSESPDIDTAVETINDNTSKAVGVGPSASPASSKELLLLSRALNDEAQQNALSIHSKGGLAAECLATLCKVVT